jgi:hypothetical protein
VLEKSATETVAALPTARHFRGVEIVTLRSGWNDPQALFVGCKGGDNRVNHGHLDLGSFVLDAAGQRWGVDLGSDNYNLPGYFGPQRWKYLRNNTLTHNTLVIDGENQSPSARAPVVSYATTATWSGAVIDLSAAWPQAKRVARGIALWNGAQVIVQDEVTSPQPVRIAWQMLTPAAVKIDGATAHLTLDKQRLSATLLSPANATWSVQDVEIVAPERPAPGIRKLTASLPQPTKDVRIVVQLTPSPGAQTPRPKIVPLANWPTATSPPPRP